MISNELIRMVNWIRSIIVGQTMCDKAQTEQ